MKVDIMGTPVDALSFPETVERIRGAMRSRVMLHQVSLNVAKLVNMRADPLLREDVLAGDIISADGMGIVLAGRLLGQPVPERVAGVDLMLATLELCAREGYRPFLLGARPEVVAQAAQAACRRFAGLRIAGMHDGYFTPEQEGAIIGEIVASGADCLFIAMPTPRKERFLKQHRSRLQLPFVMGVGGSFDILAGVVSRAPRWMQNSGLEWAYRVIQEPRRMWWRYARTNVAFAWLLGSEMVRTIWNRKRSSAPAC